MRVIKYIIKHPFKLLIQSIRRICTCYGLRFVFAVQHATVSARFTTCRVVVRLNAESRAQRDGQRWRREGRPCVEGPARGFGVPDGFHAVSGGVEPDAVLSNQRRRRRVHGDMVGGVKGERGFLLVHSFVLSDLRLNSAVHAVTPRWYSCQ